MARRTKKSKPFIMLTGDDSVRAEGLILVKRIVEKFADYAVVATKSQQSAVGGKITFGLPIVWGTEIVDGTTAYWVDGTPSDAVYFGFNKLNKKPDLVISGVNIGRNTTANIHRSGTVAAVITAVQSFLVPALATSIVTDGRWFHEHDGSFNEKYLAYPGQMLEIIIKKALSTQFEPYTFWNINFPEEATNQVRVVKTAQQAYWKNDIVMTDDDFSYIDSKFDDLPPNTDTVALNDGFISISACKIDYTDDKGLPKLSKIFIKYLAKSGQLKR